MTPLTLLVALATAYSVRLTGFFPPIVERWDDPTVTYSIQLAGSDDLPPEAAVDAVRQAFASWQDLACATVRFEELGDAPNPRTNMALGARANGINEVHWVESDWPFGAYVLGVTVPKVTPDGRLVESDIAFNGQQVQWTASGNGGLDLESVAVHEIGHFIGIQHNLGPYPLTAPPTMAPWVADGIQNRSLTPDDIAAACFLYPETPWVCDSDADCPELLSQTFETGDYYSGRFRCGDDLTCSILERFVPHMVGFGERCHRADECRDGLGCHPLGDEALCTRGCAPSAPDCPAGYRCDPMSAPLEALGVCLPVDNIIFAPAEGPEGCLDSAICAGNAACLPTPSDPDLRRCATFCSAAAPCPEGQRCHSYGGPSGACFDASLFPAEPEPEPGPEITEAAEPVAELDTSAVAEPDVSPRDAGQDLEVDTPSDSPARRSGCASGPPTALVGFLLLGLRRHRGPHPRRGLRPQPLLALCGLLISALAGCGDAGAGARDTGTDTDLGDTDTVLGDTDARDDEARSDALADLETPAPDGPDASPTPAVPRIDEVLACGVDGDTGGLAASNSNTALERKTLDTARFPDALCNDGSAAVIYIRRATRSEDTGKWVLELMGGGGCNSVAACARRWCGVDTNFSRTQMTSLTSPSRTRGAGILARPEDGGTSIVNPWADWNHVLVKYCSSDTWRGTARDVVVDTVHPKTGEPITFRMHFLGRRILEAVVATLRADGGPPLTYGADSMPDLDDATEVVFAGASAGGGGVTFNLDWLADTLRTPNPGVFVSGLIDSTFGPDLTALDFSQSTYCQTEGRCTAEAFLTWGRVAQDTLWRAAPEASCDAAHVANGEGWRCASDTFVMLNHLTTPFFVRQGLADGLISDVYVEGGLRHDGQPMDLRAFGGLVRNHLRTFPTLAETALEGAAITTAPGAFGPACSKHETLRSNGDTFSVTITVGGDPLAMFDVWQRWRLGESPSVVVTDTAADTRCAD